MHCRFIVVSGLLLSVSSVAAPLAVSETQADPLKRFDLRVQPVGLLFGVFGAALDVGVGDSWSLGGSFSQVTPRDGVTELTAWEYGVYGTYFFNKMRFTDTWFVRPGFYFTPITVTNASKVKHTLYNYNLATIVGHQWVWHDGINSTFGVGLEYHQTSSSNYFRSGSGGITNPTTAGNEVQPIMELSVGWAF